MDPQKQLLNWERLIITTLLVVVASAVTSSITWFILDRTFNASQQDNAALVATLEKKITYLDKRLGDSTATGDVTSVGGTYTDKTGLYSFSIPAGYTVTNIASCEGLCSSLATINLKGDNSASPLELTVKSFDYKKSITLEAWNKETNFVSASVQQNGTATIAGLAATKYTSPSINGLDVNYRFIKGNIAYDIFVGGGVDTGLAKSILSSFKLQ